MNKNNIEEYNQYQRDYYKNNRGKKSKIKRLSSYDTEIEAVNILKGSVRINSIYDLDWFDKKVDVKACCYEKVKLKLKGKVYYSYRWRFSTKRQKGIVDYYFLIGKDEKGEKTKFMMLIPEKEVTKTAVSISQKNFHKFTRYLIK